MRYFLLFGFLIPVCLYAQIVPPGLGSTRNASWGAIGIQQKIKSERGNWTSETYTGMGRMSGPQESSPFLKPAIFIVNQEFKNRFRESLEYTIALSYRRQNEYAKSFPFEDKGIKQEFRLYSRFSYIIKKDWVEITPTFRQEFQKFFSEDFSNIAENIRLRSRFRLKFKFPLSEDKQHHLTFYSEQLFSVSNINTPSGWTSFKYRDSRFSLYYSFSPTQFPVTFNAGYMNNLLDGNPARSANYFALDIIWKNPFGKR